MSLLCLEEQDGAVSEVKIDEVLCLYAVFVRQTQSNHTESGSIP